jgi:hypothetical protein
MISIVRRQRVHDDVLVNTPVAAEPNLFESLAKHKDDLELRGGYYAVDDVREPGVVHKGHDVGRTMVKTERSRYGQSRLYTTSFYYSAEVFCTRALCGATNSVHD